VYLELPDVQLDPQTITVLAILFFASMVGATFGFGIGLISMPLLALCLPVRSATPLVGLVGCTVSLAILWRSWNKVDMRSAWRLVAGGVLGIPVGLFLLKGSADLVMKTVLAALIVGFALYRLFSPRLFSLRSEKTAPLFGFFGGVLGGAYNTSGPPVIIYGSLRGWSPENYRASLQGYFVPAGAFALVGQAAAGLWTGPVLRLYLASLPGILVALLLGGLLHRTLPQGKFDRFVYLLLLAIGVLLGIQQVAGEL